MPTQNFAYAGSCTLSEYFPSSVMNAHLEFDSNGDQFESLTDGERKNICAKCFDALKTSHFLMATSEPSNTGNV